MSKIALGTAQFGHAYGITNTAGRLSDARVLQLVERAIEGGIRTFDTAVAYGDAESRLARALKSCSQPVRVITKISLSDAEQGDPRDVIARSAQRFEGTRVDVLLHSVSDFRHPELPRLIEALLEARENGTVTSVGASVYDERDWNEAWGAVPDLDVIQFPGSVVDTRLLDSATVARSHASGVELHLRSVFLQGLLLSTPDKLPSIFSPLRDVIERLETVAQRFDVSRVAAALQPILRRQDIAHVVVGAASPRELEEILGASSRESEIPEFDLPAVDSMLLDPRRWKELG